MKETNNTIAIILSWANTPNKHIVLDNILGQLDELGIDTLLSTHLLPIQELKNNPQHLIYDYTNPVFTWPDRCMAHWDTKIFDNTKYKLEYYIEDYGWTPFNLMLNAFYYLQNHPNYDRIFLINYDTILTQPLIEKLTSNTPTGETFPPQPDIKSDGYSLIFASFTRQHINQLISMININDYKNHSCAEDYFRELTQQINITHNPEIAPTDVIRYTNLNYDNSAEPRKYKFFIGTDDPDNVTHYKYLLYDIKQNLTLYTKDANTPLAPLLPLLNYDINQNQNQSHIYFEDTHPIYIQVNNEEPYLLQAKPRFFCQVITILE